MTVWEAFYSGILTGLVLGGVCGVLVWMLRKYQQA